MSRIHQLLMTSPYVFRFRDFFRVFFYFFCSKVDVFFVSFGSDLFWIEFWRRGGYVINICKCKLEVSPSDGDTSSGPQLYDSEALPFTYDQNVIIELADKLYDSVTVCFCVSLWIFIRINNFSELPTPGFEPLTLGLQSLYTMRDPPTINLNWVEIIV